MKRTISLALSLVLLLCLLPTTVYAGGGGAALIWSEDFSTDLSENWMVFDLNGDGYSFGWNSEEGCVQSGAIVGMGLLPEEPQPGSDYLISPPITLREGEDLFSYKYSGPEGAPLVRFEVYVYCGSYSLASVETEEEMEFVLGEPVQSYSWSFLSQWNQNVLDLTAWAGETVQLVFRQRADQPGCCLMLDDLSIYWNEPDEILDKVTAIDVPEPEIGKSVADCKESTICFPEEANYTLVPGSLRYYHTVDEQMKPFDGTFTYGEEYALTFEVRVKPGSEVSEQGIASVNGRWALFEPKGEGIVELTCWFRRFPLALSSVDVSTEPFLAGRKPDYTPETADPAHCTAADCVYVRSEGFSDLKPDDVFELGKDYIFMILLKPAEGWCFSNETQVRINGVEADFANLYGSCGVYSVRFTVDHVLFEDVPGGQWYTGAVQYCYEHGYMAGTGGYSFSPNAQFTRAMFVTVLSKIAGADVSGYTGSSFQDVPAGTWYSKPVEWAFQNGYTSGTGDGKFSPDMPLTRETLATFLYSYTKKAYGANLDDEDWADLTAYPDGEQVSGWASSPMRWAVYNGFISGVSVDGELWLQPNAPATRAQVALIVMKYCQYLVETFLP